MKKPTKFRHVKAIIWDLDETLANTVGLKAARDRKDWMFCRAHFDRAKPYPEIIEVYETLAESYLTAIVTNSPKWYATNVVDRMKIKAKVFLARGHTRQHKPHPAPILKACQLLGVSPEDCIVIGDSASDYMACLAAGGRFIGVGWGKLGKAELKKLGASLVVERPKQILELL